MWRCFPPLFHCKKSCELDADSFEVNGVAYSVPCVFQIWVKQSEPRVDSPPIHEVGFHYGKKSDGYDIAFRRVGVYAGKAFVSDSGTGTYSEQSHYFLSLLPAFLPHKEKIVEAINAHTFPSNTTGPRSISKSEANAVINEILGGLVPEDAST
jgi:hypothetical protein